MREKVSGARHEEGRRDGTVPYNFRSSNEGRWSRCKERKSVTRETEIGNRENLRNEGRWLMQESAQCNMPSVSMYSTAPPSPPASVGRAACTAIIVQNCVLPAPGGPVTSVTVPDRSPPRSARSSVLIDVGRKRPLVVVLMLSSSLRTAGPPTSKRARAVVGFGATAAAAAAMTRSALE
jgi:hypothetical protein